MNKETEIEESTDSLLIESIKELAKISYSRPVESIRVERAMHLLKEEEGNVVEYTYKKKEYLLRFNENKSCFENYNLHNKKIKWNKIDYSYLDLQALKMGCWIYTNDYYFEKIYKK